MELVRGAPEPVPSAETPEPVEPRPAVRLLVVDDHELFRRGLTIVLAGEEGIAVAGDAADGHSALAQAAATTPDVVLLDVAMPGMSGPDTCARLRDQCPTAAVVMLSTGDDEADVYEAVKIGATGGLRKDAPVHEVARAVHRAAEGQSLLSPAMSERLLADAAPAGQAAPPQTEIDRDVVASAREVRPDPA